MTPKVSIIIVNFNTEKITRDCIAAIRESVKSVGYEIIVVDNGSQDGSVKMLRDYAAKLKNFFLIENKDNLGFAKGNNQGARRARGRYLLLLNTDTIIRKGALEKMVKFGETTPDAGVIGPKLLNADGSLQPSCMNFPTVRNALREYFGGQRGLFDKFSPKGNKPRKVDSVVGAAFLITPRAVDKVGLLDERYFFYFEDIDYCRRVWKSGLKVYYLQEAQIVHYHGVSGRHLADDKNQWRRLIPSSKIYHGTLKHYLLTSILWVGQKWQKVLALFGVGSKTTQ